VIATVGDPLIIFGVVLLKCLGLSLRQQLQNRIVCKVWVLGELPFGVDRNASLRVES
jgi:hypothetical protein